jgi:hypothetical protein
MGSIGDGGQQPPEQLPITKLAVLGYHDPTLPEETRRRVKQPADHPRVDVTVGRWRVVARQGAIRRGAADDGMETKSCRRIPAHSPEVRGRSVGKWLDYQFQAGPPSQWGISIEQLAEVAKC